MTETHSMADTPKTYTLTLTSAEASRVLLALHEASDKRVLDPSRYYLFNDLANKVAALKADVPRLRERLVATHNKALEMAGHIQPYKQACACGAMGDGDEELDHLGDCPMGGFMALVEANSKTLAATDPERVE